MTGLTGFAYHSKAVRTLAPLELDTLLASARRFNSDASVTGALFHHDGRFFQYLEGPFAGVAKTLERIARSNLHTDIVELANEAIAQRQFATWHMAFCEAPATAMQALSSLTWEEAMPITRHSFERSPLLEMVLYYWNKWSAEAR